MHFFHFWSIRSNWKFPPRFSHFYEKPIKYCQTFKSLAIGSVNGVVPQCNWIFNQFWWDLGNKNSHKREKKYWKRGKKKAKFKKWSRKLPKHSMTLTTDHQLRFFLSFSHSFISLDGGDYSQRLEGFCGPLDMVFLFQTSKDYLAKVLKQTVVKRPH